MEFIKLQKNNTDKNNIPYNTSVAFIMKSISHEIIIDHFGIKRKAM